MRTNYRIRESTDKLIHIEPAKETYRSARPKESLLDRAQIAYLRIKERTGINLVPSPTMLAKEMGCADSTFEDNFCGVNGLLEISERVVLDRFTEATLDVADDIDSSLQAGLQALYKVNAHSRFNPYKKTAFNMNLRTRFALEVFGAEYWRLVFEPLIPAISSYLVACYPRWADVPEIDKKTAYSIFSNIFRQSVLSMIQKDLSTYSLLEQKKQLKIIVEQYKSLLRSLAWCWIKEDCFLRR